MIKFLSIFLFFPLSCFVQANIFQFEKIEYGKSFENRPLIAYRILKNTNFISRKAILLSEGVHGNEYSGTLEELISQKNFQDLFPELLGSFLDSGGILYVIPQVNPDAVAHQSRYTSFGGDLNRDFKKFNHQESYMLTRWIDSELKKYQARLALAIDYHCCGNALLLPNANDLNLEVKQSYQAIYDIIRNNAAPDLKMNRTTELFGQEFQGTLKDYWFKTYNALSFTIERKNLHVDTKASLTQQNKLLSQLSRYIEKSIHQNIVAQNSM